MTCTAFPALVWTSIYINMNLTITIDVYFFNVLHVFSIKAPRNYNKKSHISEHFELLFSFSPRFSENVTIHSGNPFRFRMEYKGELWNWVGWCWLFGRRHMVVLYIHDTSQLCKIRRNKIALHEIRYKFEYIYNIYIYRHAREEGGWSKNSLLV